MRDTPSDKEEASSCNTRASRLITSGKPMLIDPGSSGTVPLTTTANELCHHVPVVLVAAMVVAAVAFRSL